MASTYTPIATTTLGASASSVTFSGISGSYTDLVLIASAGTVTGNDNIGLRVGNGSADSGSNYSVTVLTGNGTAAASDRQSNQTSILTDYYGSIGTTMNAYPHIINIMNYSNTTTYKTVLMRANRADSGTDAIVGLWRSTSAINYIYLFPRGGSLSFNTGSTFTLYGIKAA